MSEPITAVHLRVMEIRDGRTGEPQNVGAILSGKKALLAHFKIHFDSYDGSASGGDPTQADAAQVEIVATYNGQPDLSVDGTQDGQEGHFTVANSSRWDKHGYAPWLKLAQGSSGGQNTAEVYTTHAGVKSNVVSFPAVD